MNEYTFTQSMSRGLVNRPLKTLDRPKSAAVLVGWIDDEDGPRILLTRRTSHLRTHAGEVSFPGGGLETVDQGDPIHAALREAREEINLNPSHVEILGQLDDMVPKSEITRVTPIVAKIHTKIDQLQANPNEVARIFTIPLAALLNERLWTTQKIKWRGILVPIYHHHFDGEELWGLSATITLMSMYMAGASLPVDLSWYINRYAPPSH